MSDLVRVRFKVEGSVALVSTGGGVRTYQNDEEDEIPKKEALRLMQKGKCEILMPERKIAARKKAPVTR